MADQLKQALLNAGFKQSVSTKKKELKYLGQCKCGAILTKNGRCLVCEGLPISVLRKREN